MGLKYVEIRELHMYKYQKIIKMYQIYSSMYHYVCIYIYIYIIYFHTKKTRKTMLELGAKEEAWQGHVQGRIDRRMGSVELSRAQKNWS